MALARSAMALLAVAGCAAPERDVASAPRFAAAAADLESFIRREMADKGLPALSIAVVDRQDGEEPVLARGFGWADPERRVPARAGTVYRVGSISKLFTDLAIMQLWERGALDLDAPVTEYLPDFRPTGSTDVAITLRHLMAHHAGLVREPPVGHYFEPTGPTLAATVASLCDSELCYEPGERLKYSNAGLAVVGRVIEVVTGRDFAEYVDAEVVAPLGLCRTSFELTPAIAQHRAKGFMWTYDGRQFAAPEFALGMGPAANLYSTAADLARFARSWFVPADGSSRGVVQERTLRAMFEPQFGTDARRGIGLGFFLGELDGHRRVSHNGAMYGFATEVAALPEAGLAVAVVTSMDFAGAVPQRVADRALRWLLALREGRELAADPGTEPVGRERARALEGVYELDGQRLRLYEEGGELLLEPRSGFRATVRAAGDRRLADDRLAHGAAFVAGRDAVQWMGRWFVQVEDQRPPPPPAAWAELIGEYGWDHDTLFVLERDGELCVLIEWLCWYPLSEQAPGQFRLPDHGLYAGERVTFGRGNDGGVTHVVLGGVEFERRRGPDDGEVFRIEPQLPEAELRAAALAATPPAQPQGLRSPELIAPAALDPTIRLDIRYATANNFLGMVVYPAPVALLQRPAAEALVRVHRRLRERGYGLLIHDAYRPWFVTKMFFDATPEELRRFVADPAEGSRHNRGCAVDLTLCELASGWPVRMVSGYDEFTARAYPRYPGGTSLQRWHRDLLRRSMEAEGFAVYEHEWWHFDYRDWRHYPVQNTSLK